MRLRAKQTVLGVIRTFPVGQPFTSDDVMKRLPGNNGPIPSEVTHILPTLSEIERIGVKNRCNIYTRRDPDEV